MPVKLPNDLRVVRGNKADWEKEHDYTTEDHDCLVPVADLRQPEDVHHDDKAGVRWEANAVLVERLAIRVDHGVHGAHCDQYADETGPVGAHHEDKEAALKPLHEDVANHRVTLAQFVAKKMLFVHVLLFVDLELVPQIVAVLSQYNRIANEEKVVDEVRRGEASQYVEEKFGGTRYDRFRDDQTDEVCDVVCEGASMPEEKPA